MAQQKSKQTPSSQLFPGWTDEEWSIEMATRGTAHEMAAYYLDLVELKHVRRFLGDDMDAATCVTVLEAMRRITTGLRATGTYLAERMMEPRDQYNPSRDPLKDATWEYLMQWIERLASDPTDKKVLNELRHRIRLLEDNLERALTEPSAAS